MTDTPLDNVQHDAFAKAVAAGANQTDAYITAGYACTTIRAATVNAAKLAKRQDIIDRINHLRLQGSHPAAAKLHAAAHARLMTIEIKREALYRIVTDERSRPGDIIRAIEVDGKYAGDLAPEKSYQLTATLEAGQPGSAARSMLMRAAAADLQARILAGSTGNLREVLESTMKESGPTSMPDQAPELDILRIEDPQ